ncbi:mycothiol acetyltransferase [Methanobrevibacter cuticularis]|uniref:Mycothiol acetyltransferase n=1 Tax=Methanobrevibacter cuticularis TaxID=47311 RepID=A0A166EJ18_9EURY|nr:GNAT family N-acetyltransferase [Methanobrevibacter cuticularis]KZX16709.1 mycothiol acetyltransferase [Methanobrevibacter cuticularis]
MIIEELNVDEHNIDKVANLIYYVDEKTYFYIFKSEKKAVSAIKRLLLSESNFIKENNVKNNNKRINLFVILDNGENKNIIGILGINKGKKENFSKSLLYMFKLLNPWDAVRFSMMFFIDNKILATVDEDDFYLAEIVVDEAQRGKGLGSEIINKMIDLAKSEGFKRVVLDVDFTNDRAKKLYKSLGFKKFNEKSFKVFSKERGMHNMEYVLE